ncbi:hypothetical protein DJ021_03150 [Phenylobacterium hankyongense]|uniref:General stress protein FMN-binding split barrel domain-containing protein n=1 Tax=Phenylobacterium hankyongense TaxID=1813876 RepID=A0A328AW86_9CAUL|nr:pyridoxamine 5'-phosphate oxidase family protein [Phenylobacterium hankyongense]RAK58867.1 hypothetical protein DJ021_03150 [Phenylobacterium hankyongense]
MTTDTHDRAAVETRLWDEIEKHRTGMLGVVGGEPQHFQPMTAFLERGNGEIWFFTYRDSDLARAAGSGAPSMFVFQLKDIQACIGGRLSDAHDVDRMDKYWNPVVAAWYPKGRDDPRLTMLRLDCDDAQVWISEAGPARFAWEITRANATHRTPDLGGSAHLDLH